LQQRRQEEADRKERWTQIKQLIEQHRLPKLETDEYFNFVSRGKVRRLSVDAPLRERIVSGELAIVVAKASTMSCRAILESVFAATMRALSSPYRKSASAAPAEDDPYKDYVVPDDLKW
jgi:uncharacterized protein YaiL (DUF2058 family)